MNSVYEDPAYHRLKRHLIASTGLSFYADRDDELADLIADRLAALRVANCTRYEDFLTSGVGREAEMEVLIGKLTIGETSFFRDPEQFAAIRDIVLPDILERKQQSKQLRIWSAGCAAGAEPYSLAIMLARDLADRIEGWQVDIRATDLNRSFLAKAVEGNFRAWALCSISDEIRRECFTTEGSTWTIHVRYKRWISFQYMNLVDSKFLPPLTPGTHFDLILCRNVIIYFTTKINHRLSEQIWDSLEFGGWLLVGSSEHHPQSCTAFRGINAAGTKLYQKTSDPVSALEVARLEAPSPAADAPRSLPAPPPTPMPAPVLGSAAHVLASSVVCGPAIRNSAVSDRTGEEVLRQLVDCGDWQGSAECSQSLLAEDKWNPAVYLYQALAFEKLGSSNASERSLRQAIYVDRMFAMAHYHLALALKRDCQMLAAARSFDNVIRILAEEAAEMPVMAGAEVTVTELRDLAGMQLEGLREA